MVAQNKILVAREKTNQKRSFSEKGFITFMLMFFNFFN